MDSSTIKGITVKLGGDTKDLQSSFDKLDKKSRNIQKELNLVNKELKFNPDSAVLLAQKQELLEEKIVNSRKALEKFDSIKDEVERKAKSGDLGADEYRAYQREVEKTKSQLEYLEKELDKTSEKFGTIQRRSGEVTFKNAENKVDHLKGKFKDLADDAGKSLDTISEKSGKIGDALESAGNTVNKGSMAAAAVLAGSVAAYKDLDSGYDSIVKKTGATGDKLEGLKQIADSIFGSNVFDMTDIGNAIGEINTRFGYTDERLKSITENYLQFAKINDTDVSDSVSKSARIMEAWNVSSENLPTLLDMITAKAQETGIGVDVLMDAVISNNSTFKEMGLSLEESIGLMAQFEKNGVDSSTALTALKAAVKNSTKEGKSLTEALGENIEKIKSAATETEALQIATNLFGTKGAAEMTNSIREGRIDLNKLSGSMSDYKNTVKDTYEGTLDPLDESKVAINNLKLAGTQLASVALKEGEPLIEDVIDGIKGVTGWLKKLTPEQKKTLTEAIKIVAVAGPAVTIGGKIAKGISSITSTASKLIPKLIGATAAQEGLNVAQNSNPIGLYIIAITAAVAALAGLKAAIDEANQQQLSDLGFTEQAEKMQEAVERVSSLRDEVTGLADEIKSSMSDTSADLGTIDEYKNRLDELLEKSDWSNVDQEEFKTIGAYFSEKYPEFKGAWDKYISVDENGKVTINGNINDIKENLDTLIKKYKKVAASQALSNLSIEDTEAYVKAKQDTNEAAVNYVEAQKELNEWLKKFDVDDELIELLKTANESKYQPAAEAALASAEYRMKQSGHGDITAEELYKQYKELKEGVDSVSGSFDEMVSKTAELKKNSEQYNQMQAVLNGSYENASAVLTAYYNNLITKEDIEKSKWGSLESLRVKAKETAEETGKSETYIKQITDESTDYAKFKLGMIEGSTGAAVDNAGKKMGKLPTIVEGTMIESTQKVVKQIPEMKSAMGDSASLGVKEFSIKVNEGIPKVKNDGKNFVQGFINGLIDRTGISKVWNAAINIGSAAIEGLRDILKIHSPSGAAEEDADNYGGTFADRLLKNTRKVRLAGKKLGENANIGLKDSKFKLFFDSGNVPTFDLSGTYASLQRLKQSKFSGSTKTVSSVSNSSNVNNAKYNFTINEAGDPEATAQKIADIIIRDGMKWG